MHVRHGKLSVGVGVHLRHKLPHRIHVHIRIGKVVILLILPPIIWSILFLQCRIATTLILTATLCCVYSLLCLFLSFIAWSIIWLVLSLCFHLDLLDFLLLFLRRKLTVSIALLRHSLEYDLCARLIILALLPEGSIARLFLLQQVVLSRLCGRIGGIMRRRVIIGQLSLFDVLILADTLHDINADRRELYLLSL